MADLEWKLYSLEMDKSGVEIGEFFESQGYDIKRVDPAENIYRGDIFYRGNFRTKKDVKNAIKKHVMIEQGQRILALNSDGHFHHFTYGLCRLADQINEEYCYIHIDQHHDWWWNHKQRPHAYEKFSCGSFVEKIFQNTNVRKKIRNLMFIGNRFESLLESVPESKKNELLGRCLFESQLYDSNTRQYKDGWLKIVENMLNDSHNNVYVSMDLDVLHGNDFLTEYEPGIMRSVQLMQALTLIKMKKNIIGADVVGYVGRNKEKGLQIYKTIVNTLLQ